ncbi:2-hydroxyacid dehydrogenase [Sediminivirga luteola]|uniref:Dehydrogenase n=2 Tax=Sediminivirga luteola TaxID=1774748 RepID=A0A8J2TV36_9MICO|nr:dehydrogenase [Sediminivirga luteola]
MYGRGDDVTSRAGRQAGRHVPVAAACRWQNGAMTTLDISTIAFPEPVLRDRVARELPAEHRETLDLVVWSAEHPDADPAGIDAVILPYLDSGRTLARAGELTRLKLAHTQTTGYDGVPAAVGEGVAIATARGVHAAATAELALGLTLASLRGIDEAARDMTTASWNHLRRPSLADRRVMVIGVGGIGEEIARRLDPFEVELIRVGTRARQDARGQVHGVDELPQLLPQTEVVILITPLTELTEHLVDREFLAALPDGALVVNVARGRVVETEALVAELRTGRLAAALDVTDPEPLPRDHPLWSTPNTLITPHVGGDTSAFEPRIVALLADQLTRIAEGRELRNLVS